MISPAQDDLEQSVIGAVILRPDSLPLLSDLGSGEMMTPIARATWDTIRNLEAANLPIDITTIGDELCRARSLRAVEKESYADSASAEVQIWDFLHLCATRVPTVDNAIEYSRRLKDHALRRRLVDTLGEVIDEAKNGDMTGADLLTLALGGLSILDAEAPERASTIGEILKRRLGQLEQIQRDREQGVTSLSGVHTGVAKLDDKIGGWQPGIVSIVAARPGMGKSSLGLATADACSAKGQGVHLFSLEDTEAAYADRVMARTSDVPAELIRNAQLDRGQLDRLQGALKSVSPRKQWLVDGRSGVTAQEIVRSVRRHKRDNQTRVVIVDYVQLVAKARHMQRATAHEVLSDTMTVFADAAKQDGLAYVIMSQLNREIEKRTDRRPQLADLRESGSLEERAKCVIGLYRGAAYGGKPKRGVDFPQDAVAELSQEDFDKQIQLIVLKNSNGRTGTVKATWSGPTTKIE